MLARALLRTRINIPYTPRQWARPMHDPYQCHRTITTLQRAGLPIIEYPQTTANTTRMGQTLFDLLHKGQNPRRDQYSTSNCHRGMG